MCGINGAPLLARFCPLLSTFRMGPPRPPHWDLRARSSNKDSAGGSSTEIWLTVEWKRKEFWQTENGGSEKQLYMLLRGAATTYEREQATRSQGMQRTLRNIARGWIHELWLTLNHLCALNEADVHRHEEKSPTSSAQDMSLVTIVSVDCGFPWVNLAQYKVMLDGCCVILGPVFVAFHTWRQIQAATEVPC